MRYPSTSLIAQIKKERKRKEITQTELATMLGLPQPSIARIETGVVSPTLGMLERICDALGLEMLVQKHRVIPRRVNLVVDMHGCPNRCLHCWLGDLPSRILNDDGAEWIASLFRPYFKDLTFYSWLRDPDFAQITGRDGKRIAPFPRLSQNASNWPLFSPIKRLERIKNLFTADYSMKILDKR